MREQILDKIDFFCKNTLNDLSKISIILGKITPDLWLYECTDQPIENATKVENKNGSTVYTFDTNRSIEKNASIITKEIIDDFSCSFFLYKNGFFKQTKQILRNNIELVIQLLYVYKLIKEDSEDLGQWVKGNMGVEQVKMIADDIRRNLPEFKDHINELKKLYNLLNAPTHSHKNYLNSRATVSWENHVLGFDTRELINTKRILLFVSHNVINLLIVFFLEQKENHWRNQIIIGLDKALKILLKYSKSIETYKKGNYEKGEGFLIFKEHMKLENRSIEYSYRADNFIKYSSKKNIGHSSEWKLITQRIDERLLADDKK